MEKIINSTTYFRGAAQTLWRHLANATNLQTMTWEEFKTTFRLWQTVNTVRVARDQIAYLKQLTSVRDYTQRFLDLKVQITSMTEEESVDKYVRGLKPNIRRDLEQMMAREGDMSLEEMIRFADRTDSIDYQARRYRPNGGGPTPMDLGAVDGDEEESDALDEDSFTEEDEDDLDNQDLAAVRMKHRTMRKEKGKKPPPLVNPEESIRRRELNLCYNCSEAGHQSRRCPQRRGPQRNGKRNARLSTIELCTFTRESRVNRMPSRSCHAEEHKKVATVVACTHPLGTQQRRKLVEATHRRLTVKNEGPLGVFSRETQVRNPSETSQPEVELSGLGVNPLKFTGLVAGQPVEVMIDSGAAGDLISQTVANRLGMRKVLYNSNTNVQLADGSKIAMSWKTPMFNLRIGKHRERLQLHGLPLKGHEIILGRPWLQRWNPSIDWRTGTVAFPQRGENIVLEATVARGFDEGCLISALQTKRAMRKGNVSLLAIITPWPEEGESSEEPRCSSVATTRVLGGKQPPTK